MGFCGGRFKRIWEKLNGDKHERVDDKQNGEKPVLDTETKDGGGGTCEEKKA